MKKKAPVRKTKSAVAGVTLAQVRAMISAGVAKNVEKKSVAYIYGGPRTIFPAVAGDFQLNTGNTIPLTPESTNLTIPQGNGQSSRVGNEIKPASAWFKYALYPKAYNASTNVYPKPTIIQIFIWSPKTQFNDLANARNITVNSFFNVGSTYQGFANTFQDILLQPNKDMVTVHKLITHKIGYAKAEGQGNDSFDEYSSNNDFNLSATGKVNVLPYLPSTFHWNDTATTISDRAVYVTYSYVYATGGNPGYLPASIYCNMEVEYTDE